MKERIKRLKVLIDSIKMVADGLIENGDATDLIWNDCCEAKRILEEMEA